RRNFAPSFRKITTRPENWLRTTPHILEPAHALRTPSAPITPPSQAKSRLPVLHRDNRVTTAPLPHGHSALRSRRSLRPSLAIALAAACLPALAASPEPAKADAAPLAATAAPAPIASLALPAPAAIATPDTAPLAAQLEILQKAK